MSVHIVIELVKGLAWLGENLPDNPRLGRKLLLGGGMLLCAFFVPERPEEWADAILIVKVLSEIAGSVCLILGGFIFFRRWVWRRQEKRPPIITSIRWK
jgi:hypothetical protein